MFYNNQTRFVDFSIKMFNPKRISNSIRKVDVYTTDVADDENIPNIAKIPYPTQILPKNILRSSAPSRLKEFSGGVS